MSTRPSEEFKKKINQIETLLAEVMEEAEHEGWQFGISYNFKTLNHGTMYYSGEGEWAHSNC